MSSYPLVPIREIARIHYGKALKAEDRLESGFVPIFGSSGQIGFHDKSLVNYPTLIVGRKGSVGQVTYADKGGWAIDTVFYTEFIKPDEVDLRFFFYALKRSRLDRWTITTSIPGLNRDDFYATQIPLPPLQEQRRIAAILDKADAVRRKRQDAIALTEELLQSAFLEMFGDPVTNPKGWNTDYLGNYILNANNGLSRRRKTFQNEGEIVLRLQDIKAGYISFSEPNRIALDEAEKKRYLLKSNDLVFIRVNGNKNYVGRCAVYKDVGESIYHNDHIIRIQTSAQISPEYLAFVFNHPSGEKILQSQIKTSVGQYTISQRGIESLQLPIPQKEIQDEFIKLSGLLEETKSRYQNSLIESQTLFNSLLQRAFRGEL